MESINGYGILKATVFETGRGFALGHDPQAAVPFVVWHFSEMADGNRHYYDCRPCNGIIKPEAELDRVISAYEYVHGVSRKREGLQPEKEYYRYYSTQRPVDIGTFPSPKGNPPVDVANYAKRSLVEDGAIRAWGELVYAMPLTKGQMDDYELRAAPANPDRARDRPSITARLKEAAPGTEREAVRGKNVKKREGR